MDCADDPVVQSHPGLLYGASGVAWDHIVQPNLFDMQILFS